jgi:hypothetical protein
MSHLEQKRRISRQKMDFEILGIFIAKTLSYKIRYFLNFSDFDFQSRKFWRPEIAETIVYK